MNANFLLTLCGIIVAVPLATTVLLAGFARIAGSLVQTGALIARACRHHGQAANKPIYRRADFMTRLIP